MRLAIVLASSLLCVTGLSVQAQSGGSTSDKKKHKHPHLHHALWALHHAHDQLKESKEGYLGHKKNALHAIHQAAQNIEAILKHEKDDFHSAPSKAQLAQALKKYKHHPHLHHALQEVKSAHHQLKETKNDFGGHRHKALVDMDHAIQQIELLLKHANAEVKKK